MRYSIYMFLICSLLVNGSCKNNKPETKVTMAKSDWRYFGESPPQHKAKLFSPSVISTPKNERDFAMSPSGSEIFYSLVLPSNNLSVIVYLVNDGAFWSDKLIAPFSGRYSDLEPTFSPDGKQLFFVSKRPQNESDKKNDWNIWKVSKTENGWSDPVAIGPPVNGDEDEYYPSVSNAGNLYFTSPRKGGFGFEDIYVAHYKDDSYDDPVNLGPQINSEGYEFNAFIAPDESYLLFSSFNREDGFGGGDLYISFRVNDTTWVKAKNLGPDINSDKLDYCPFVSPDGKYLFFTSQRIDPKITDNRHKSYNTIINLIDGIENGFGNIYWVSFDPAQWK